MRKSFLHLILILFALTLLAQRPSAEALCTSTFKDIPQNTDLCYYVNFLDYQRVVRGYDDLTYRPDEYITRGQMAKFIANAFKISTPNPDDKDEKAFEDVDQEHVFFSYIYALKEEK